MAKKLTKREHDIMHSAVVLGLKIEYDACNRSTWDGDYLLPFRAHETLKKLVKAGLMEQVLGGIYGRQFRATDAGKQYECRGIGCCRGTLYQASESAWDEEVGKCQACCGTGLLLNPRHTPRGKVE